MLALQDLDAAAGDDLVQLDSETLSSAFAELITSLAKIARQRGAGPERWRLAPDDRG